VTTVYASIGNSDDKLTQARWADFHHQFAEHIHGYATRVYGDWLSAPASAYQNACIAFEIDADKTDELKYFLSVLAADFDQDSIAWAVTGETEFVGPWPVTR
jgi:methionine synthase II (cobalamin-independent)